jgi:hypothetical protein
MTKKHYIAIAAIIKSQINNAQLENSLVSKDIKEGAEIASSCIAESLADCFAEENPNFDRLRFLSACGIE